MHAQPRRLVGEQAERRAVGLREAEAREPRDHLEDLLGELLADVGVLGHRALDEAAVVGLDRLRRALAAHRPAQPLGLPDAEARERLRDLEHLVLEDDRAERVAQRLLERRVQVGDLERRVGAQALAALDVRVDRAADDRPRPHDRDLDRDLVEVLRARAPQRAHLRARLDLKDAGRVGVLDALVGRRVVEGDPREVDPLAAPRRDVLDAALDGAQHPQAEQVDLQEARVRAGVLVPLRELAALHRRRHERDAVDERARRDDHPARVLGEVARQPVGLLRQAREPRPAARPAALRRAPCRCRGRRRASTSPRCRARRARSRPAAARAPCRARGSRRARGRSGRPRRAPSARCRSARGCAGSAPRGCRAGSRGRCRAAP